MRTLENVMKARWPLPRWASSGVTTVMKPQVEADSKMTFSPPMLEEAQGRAGWDGCLRGLVVPPLTTAQTLVVGSTSACPTEGPSA